jgi:hypothetical protein
MEHSATWQRQRHRTLRLRHCTITVGAHDSLPAFKPLSNASELMLNSSVVYVIHLSCGAGHGCNWHDTIKTYKAIVSPQKHKQRVRRLNFKKLALINVVLDDWLA